MDVVHGLSRVRAGIEDNAVPGAGDALGDRHLPRVRDKLSQQVLASSAELRQVRVVIPRNDQHVDRSLRVYVAKGNRAGIR